MVWPGEVWHYILYGLADMTWYMITPGEVWHVCGNAYVNFIFYGIALGYDPVPMSVGGRIHTNRTRSQVEGHACSGHMHRTCSLWAEIVN